MSWRSQSTNRSGLNARRSWIHLTDNGLAVARQNPFSIDECPSKMHLRCRVNWSKILKNCCFVHAEAFPNPAFYHVLWVSLLGIAKLFETGSKLPTNHHRLGPVYFVGTKYGLSAPYMNFRWTLQFTNRNWHCSLKILSSRAAITDRIFKEQHQLLTLNSFSSAQIARFWNYLTKHKNKTSFSILRKPFFIFTKQRQHLRRYLRNLFVSKDISKV